MTINLDFLNNKKILITGASGLLGYNLCKKIEHTNSIIDINYLNDLHPVFNNELNKIRFGHFKFDITNEKCIKKLPKYDIIFYCSGYGQPKKFIEDPNKTFFLNTLSIFHLSNKVNTGGKFVFISSSEIYTGNTNGNKETDNILINPKNKRNCYIIGKLFGEIMLENLCKDIEYKNIRLCLGYGPGFKPGDKRVMFEFIQKAYQNGCIELIDDGSDLRNYIYIDDCINGILNICKTGKSNTYNIGGKTSITIKELAEKISQIIGCEIKIGNKQNKLIDSPNMAFVNIERYENEFGELERTNIDDGLIKTINWYKDNFIKE